MTFPHIITLYGDKRGSKTRYAKHARQLVKRCKELKLEFTATNVEPEMATFSRKLRCNIPGLSDRHARYRYISVFVQRYYYKLSVPILFVHCDTKINYLPPISCFNGLDVGYSIGYVPCRKADRALAAPIFLNPSKIADTFLYRWVYACETDLRNIGEHTLLKETCTTFNDHPCVGTIRSMGFVCRKRKSTATCFTF